jgi:hypothetical protein
MAGAANIVAFWNILRFTTFSSGADLAEITARILLRSVQTVMARSIEPDNEGPVVEYFAKFVCGTPATAAGGPVANDENRRTIKIG